MTEQEQTFLQKSYFTLGGIGKNVSAFASDPQKTLSGVLTPDRVFFRYGICN